MVSRYTSPRGLWVEGMREIVLFVNIWLIRGFVFKMPTSSPNSLFLIQSPVPEAKLIRTKLPGFLPSPIPLLLLSLLLCHSWSGTNPPPLLSFSSPLSSPSCFLWSVATRPKLIFPPRRCALALPPSFTLWLFLLPPDILLLFTSDHKCIYLSSFFLPAVTRLCYSLSFIDSQTFWKKVHKWKLLFLYVMFLPKTSNANRHHLTLCIQEQCLKEDVPCNGVPPLFKQETGAAQWE